MKPVDVITEIVISASREKVSDYAADPENAPIWYENIKSIQWRTEKPLQIGSQFAFTSHFLGKKLAYTYGVTEFIPGGKLVMRTADGPFPMETTYTWESTDQNQTLMRLRNKGIPSGFSAIFVPFMKMAMSKANEKDLKMLKEILER